MNEAVVVILDANLSMATSLSTGCISRFECAKQVTKAVVCQFLKNDSSSKSEIGIVVLKSQRTRHHFCENANIVDDEPPFPNILELGGDGTSTAVTPPSERLIKRIDSLQVGSSELLRGDFCDGILVAADSLYQRTHKKSYQRRRVILLTDAEHKVEPDPQALVAVLEGLAEMGCTLNVIGLDFDEQSNDMDEDEESDSESDDDDDEEDEDDIDLIRSENRSFLSNLSEKSGGYFFAAKKLKPIIQKLGCKTGFEQMKKMHKKSETESSKQGSNAVVVSDKKVQSRKRTRAEPEMYHPRRQAPIRPQQHMNHPFRPSMPALPPEMAMLHLMASQLIHQQMQYGFSHQECIEGIQNSGTTNIDELVVWMVSQREQRQASQDAQQMDYARLQSEVVRGEELRRQSAEQKKKRARESIDKADTRNDFMDIFGKGSWILEDLQDDALELLISEHKSLLTCLLEWEGKARKFYKNMPSYYFKDLCDKVNEKMGDQQDLVSWLTAECDRLIAGMNQLSEQEGSVPKLFKQAQNDATSDGSQNNPIELLLDDDDNDDDNNKENEDTENPETTVAEVPSLPVDTDNGDAETAVAEVPSVPVATKKRKSSLPTPRANPLTGRVSWDGKVDLDDWLEAARPSKISARGCYWIDIRNVVESSPGYDRIRTNSYERSPYVAILNKLESVKRKPAKLKRDTVKSLLNLAASQRYTYGKWMLFLPPEKADEAWEKIARATAKGQLGCSAKIAPSLHQSQAVCLCCIYVQDFSNRKEVKRVLLSLINNLKFDVSCGFKPDVYTDLDIMSGNKWKLPPVIYKVKEVLDEDWEDED